MMEKCDNRIGANSSDSDDEAATFLVELDNTTVVGNNTPDDKTNSKKKKNKRKKKDKKESSVNVMDITDIDKEATRIHKIQFAHEKLKMNLDLYHEYESKLNRYEKIKAPSYNGQMLVWNKSSSLIKKMKALLEENGRIEKKYPECGNRTNVNGELAKYNKYLSDFLSAEEKSHGDDDLSSTFCI